MDRIQLTEGVSDLDVHVIIAGASCSPSRRVLRLDYSRQTCVNNPGWGSVHKTFYERLIDAST